MSAIPPKYRKVADGRGTSRLRVSPMRWPVSVDSISATSSALASIASASFRSSRPRSAAARARQVGKALVAAATALSISACRASATSAIFELSCGLSTSILPRASASTNSPPINSLFCNCIFLILLINGFGREPSGAQPFAGILSARRPWLEIHRVRLQALAGIQLGQLGVVVLPHQQDRALGRIALVADVGRHRRYVARLHHHARPRLTGIAVAHDPLNLVAQLHEPLHAVVAVDDWQHVLLGGRANQRVLDRCAYRRIPGDVRARHVAEEIKGVDFILEARLGVDLGSVLRHVGELAVDRISGFVGAQRDVVLQPDHPLGGQALARDGLAVAAMLGTECTAGLLRSGEWVKALVGPVLEQRLEHRLDVLAPEIFDPLLVLLAVAAIVEPGKDVDVAVMIGGAGDVVEIDGAVKEAPCQIADHGAQEQVHRHRMAAARPLDMREVLVPLEAEFAEREIAIAKLVDRAISLFGLRHYSVLPGQSFLANVP